MFSSRRECCWCKILVDDDEPTCYLPFKRSHEYGHLACFIELGEDPVKYCAQKCKEEDKAEKRKRKLVEQAMNKLTAEERKALGRN